MSITSKAETNEKLFQEFPPISTQEWTEKVISDLKGASFEKKLVWKTGEGIDVNPFYRAEDIEELALSASLPGEFPFLRGTKTNNSWLIRQDIEVDDCKLANEKAKRLIATGGITSIGFQLKSDLVSKDAIATLLDGICPEKTELNFKISNKMAVEFIGILAYFFRTIHADLSKCKGSVRYDPLIGGQALDVDWEFYAYEIVKAGEILPEYTVLSVEAFCLSDLGASITQEVAFALASGNELIARLSEAGIPAGKVAKKIKFNFGITSNYFLEIAKFRVVRWLWAVIVKAYNPVCDCKEGSCSNEGFCACACKIKVHARTSEWNLTIYDAYNNMLRTQTEAMLAVLAGVDSITVLPYDTVFKTPDEFSERIARNQQLLLKEECHLDKVTDPAAGSYYIEKLTQSLADAVWQLFLDVEDQGDFAAYVKEKEMLRAIREMKNSRTNKIATRRQILVGTNQYPNFTEKAGEKVKYPITHTFRGASEFEDLRLATEKNGKTPKVFLLTIGNQTMRLARSQFASNFFACAGYEIIDNIGFETVEAGMQAAREKKADIIVLCSSDEEYVTSAPEAFRLIEGKEIFVVAGAPACMDELEAIGIENFIHLKSNVLELLQMFNEKLKTT